MELPFIIVFEPPSRSELRALLRMRGTWVAGLLVALAIGSLIVGALVTRSEASASGAGVPLALSSRPPGASVWLDGRERGPTSLVVPVEPGTHRVVMRTPNALDVEYTMQVGSEGASLDARLWRRQVGLTRVRPAVPGAVLSEVRFLDSGQLALSLVMPSGRQLEAWRLEPASGALEAWVPPATGARLALAPDGQRVAVIGYPIGPAAPGVSASVGSRKTPGVLWIRADGGAVPSGAWVAPLRSAEQLLDASWSPVGDGLVAVTGTVAQDAPPRTRVWRVDPYGGAAHELLTLPAEVIAGSEVWSSDGQRLVFLARSGGVEALCWLDMDGAFRSLADLVDRAGPVFDNPSSMPPGLAYPPASWSADGRRVLFVAPRQRPPGPAGGWFEAQPLRALYMASGADVAPVMLGLTEVDRAFWREDGQILGLGRLGMDGALDVRLISGDSGSSQHLVEVPLRPGASYAASWDLDRGRLVVAHPAAAGGVDYWLASLGLEGE